MSHIKAALKEMSLCFARSSQHATSTLLSTLSHGCDGNNTLHSLLHLLTKLHL